MEFTVSILETQQNLKRLAIAKYTQLPLIEVAWQKEAI